MKKVSVKCPKCGANLEVEAAEVNVVMQFTAYQHQSP